MNPTSNRSPSVAASHVVVDRYEALRRGALGAPHTQAARAGLAVLLGRGLWAWARVVADQPCTPAQDLSVVGGAARSDRLAGLLAELTLAHSGRNL